MSRQLQLAKLLIKCFSADEWYRWLRDEYGAGLVAEAPSPNVEQIKIFCDSIALLERYGHIDDGFFERLARARPKRREAIERMREEFSAARTETSLTGQVVARRRWIPPSAWRSISLAIGLAIVLTAAWYAATYEATPATATRFLMDACRESFLNLHDDVQVAPDVQALKVLLDEHIARCEPLIEHMSQTFPNEQ